MIASLSPARTLAAEDIATATYASIVGRHDPARRLIRTPITFWTIQTAQTSGPGRGGCSSACDLALSIYGPDAGLVAGIPIEHLDEDVYARFRGRVEDAKRRGFVEVEPWAPHGRGLDWAGEGPLLVEGDLRNRLTITLRRGLALTNDPAICRLAELLRANPPSLLKD